MMKEIGYCGNHCEYCFFIECDGCKSKTPSSSYANLFSDRKCPNIVCAQDKGIDGCWQCDKVNGCDIGFFRSGENDAKAYALYIQKHGTEKYNKTVLSLIKRGYNYPRVFKTINNIDKIMEIFENSEE